MQKISKYIHYQLFIVLLLLYSCHGGAQNNQTSVAKIDQLYPNLHILVKDSVLLEILQVDTEGVSFFANIEDKENNKPECKIYNTEISDISKLIKVLHPDSLLAFYLKKGTKHLKDMPAYYAQIQQPMMRTKGDSLHPLRGMRIALDPGHAEGTMEMAQIEGKFVKMRPANETGWVPIAFNEANLTLATARLLADKLTSEGAIVMITRPEVGVSMLQKPFKKWYKEERIAAIEAEKKAGRLDSAAAAFFLYEASEEVTYQRLYVALDLRMRAQKINDFHPDLTLMIHYNVHGPNWEQRDTENYMKMTDVNYNMVFVPGSFKNGELYKVEDRAAFMRLLLGEEMNQSIDFSKAVMQSYAKHLHVPAVGMRQDLIYLKNSCIAIDSAGVFARNLSLTRNVGGVLCYGESLCQDNITEAAWLNQQLIPAGPDLYTSSRVRMVADAYFEAMMQYAKNQYKKP